MATLGSALLCLPLIWLARVVYLLVGVAEGWGGRRGHAYACAATGYAMLRYSVGVGVGFLRGVLCQTASNFIWGRRDVCWGLGVGGGLVGVTLSHTVRNVASSYISIPYPIAMPL